MALIRIENLVKRFGKVEAVKGITLEVKEGEFTVLLGPSGCGKTTTLRCVAGLEAPDQGRIFFDRDEVTHLSPAARNIAFVFQLYALYPHLSVYDNIAFPLRADRAPREEIRSRVKEVLQLLQIEEVASMKPRRLTGGQKQRVALGRAIIRRPRVFLLDEPLSNVDAKLREKTRGELKKLQKSIGSTTLYVTHDQVEAMTMADKIVVMNFGDIQQIGDPHAVYHFPANLFVAHFIGSPGMNFFPGEMVRVGNMGIAIDGDFTVPLPAEQTQAIEKRKYVKDVVLGVRPENIIITDESRGVVSGETYVFEPQGAQNILTAKVGTHIIKVVLPSDQVFRVGDRVSFQFKEVRVFDRATESLIA
ncbi:MAG TPA: ABC transporter ATP-binding protein [Atribacteraceae bacterium]|nr:ABC transporter ATP-binding protein [Atribacteraceae bacterium]